MTNKIEISRELAGKLISYDDVDRLKAEQELRTILSTAVVQRQEPIGWRDPSFLWSTVRTSNKAKLEGEGHDLTAFSQPLYDSPQAPVAVVLPIAKAVRELIGMSARQADLIPGANYYTAAELAAEALLDKIKELNP